MLLGDTTIIGFGHKARHGKDTVVQTLIEEYTGKYDVRRYAFADVLKQEVEEIGPAAIAFKYGIRLNPDPPMDDPLCPSGKHSKVLQFWGEYRRKEDPFHWVKKLHQRLLTEQPRFALISDMRYLNEFLYVKSWKGWTCKVTRRGYVDLTRDPNHISETQLDNVLFDFEITVGEGEIAQLKKDAVTVFECVCANLNPVKEEPTDAPVPIAA